MPSKNALKVYLPNAYYHLYNRGVNKRTIFKDDRDYKIFLSYLRSYLMPALPGVSWKYPSKQLNNFSEKIELIAYKLMPNHFHLLIHQHKADAVQYFMRSLSTKYVRSFNNRYGRVGPLFQGTYKAVRIVGENQLLYITKYIHRNGKQTSRSLLEVSQYSSYPNYLGLIHQPWVKPDPILAHFSNTNTLNSYEAFVEDDLKYPTQVEDWSIDNDKD